MIIVLLFSLHGILFVCVVKVKIKSKAIPVTGRGGP
jgi:hypothetical protein